jgi:hypothetical protein
MTLQMHGGGSYFVRLWARSAGGIFLGAFALLFGLDPVYGGGVVAVLALALSIVLRPWVRLGEEGISYRNFWPPVRKFIAYGDIRRCDLSQPVCRGVRSIDWRSVELRMIEIETDKSKVLVDASTYEEGDSLWSERPRQVSELIRRIQLQH